MRKVQIVDKTVVMTYPSFPEKKDCCGCSACEQTCPRKCLTMQVDNEGFLYPVLDKTCCVGCLQCEKACPVLCPYEGKEPQKTFAAINLQHDIRMKSSSGGIFSLLAERTIDDGGVVFGARFDEHWRVIHSSTRCKKELSYFRGSKYVQSYIGDCYVEAKSLLDQNVPVMFVGTPCQIAGLNHYLKRSYNQLMTVDFICHGVPSPAVWQWYIEQQACTLVRHRWIDRLRYCHKPVSIYKNIEFRNKENGWKQYHIVFETKCGNQEKISVFHQDSPYMRAFLGNFDLRPSCYHCVAKQGRSHSDITIADFWNVHRVIDGFDDDRGTSLVLINSFKGQQAFNSLGCRSQEVNFKEAIQYNRAWCISYPENSRRSYFFQHYKAKLKDIVFEPVIQD